MPIYVGDKEIKGVYIGNSEAKAIYAGTNQVYPSSNGGVYTFNATENANTYNELLAVYSDGNVGKAGLYEPYEISTGLTDDTSTRNIKIVVDARVENGSSNISQILIKHWDAGYNSVSERSYNTKSSYQSCSHSWETTMKRGEFFTIDVTFTKVLFNNGTTAYTTVTVTLT